jgi:hypothetical protein
MRSIVSAALAAFSIAATAHAQASPPESPGSASWTQSIETLDWKRLGESDDGEELVFWKSPRVLANKHRTIWLRSEFQTVHDNGARSSIGLMEFDCEGKARLLQTTGYTFNNNGGNSTGTATSFGAWRYVVPDTLRAHAERIACHHAK